MTTTLRERIVAVLLQYTNTAPANAPGTADAILALFRDEAPPTYEVRYDVDGRGPDWKYPSNVMSRLVRVAGAEEEEIGWDGGEPEDQTLGRDWSWVAVALVGAEERAFARGYAKSESERAELQRRLDETDASLMVAAQKICGMRDERDAALEELSRLRGVCEQQTTIVEATIAACDRTVASLRAESMRGAVEALRAHADQVPLDPTGGGWARYWANWLEKQASQAAEESCESCAGQVLLLR